MIRIKPGANLDRMSQHIAWALYWADRVWGWNGVRECWVTSGDDSDHSEHSKHYPENNRSGALEAADLRSHNVPQHNKEQVLEDLSRVLGNNYDVVFEYPGLPLEHYHVEYDPR